MPDRNENYIDPPNLVESLTSVSEKVMRKKEQQQQNKDQHKKRHKPQIDKQLEEELENLENQPEDETGTGHIDFHA